MKKSIQWLIVLGLFIGVLVGCNQSEPNDSDEVDGNENENEEEVTQDQDNSDELVIGFSQVTMESPFYIALVEGAEQEAERQGVAIEVIDAQNDMQKQNSDVQSLLTRGIDVLLLNPTNPSAVAPSIEAAEDAGVPIVTVDRRTQQAVASYVGRDNEEMGRIAGQKAVELLGGEGNAQGKIIEIQGDAGGTVMQERHDGFHDIVGKEPGIEVIEGPYSDYIRSLAVSSMQDLIQAHPDVDLVYAHNDDMALGAVQVLQQSNLNDVNVIGIDGLMEAVKKIDEGSFDATVLNDPIRLGALAVQTAIKVANGEEVERYVDGGTELVDQSNVSEYVNDEYEFATMD